MAESIPTNGVKDAICRALLTFVLFLGERMDCKKCNGALVTGADFCHHCGAKQTREVSKRKRANGQGTVYKVGRTYRAEVTVGFHDDGRHIRRVKGGFATKKEAYDYLPSLKNVLPQKLSNITFAKLYEDWLKMYEDRISKTTRGCYAAAMNHYKPLHIQSFVSINTEHLQQCVDAEAEGKPLGIRTRENMKALAGLMYKYARQVNICDKNYAQFIYVGKREDTEQEPFTRAEVESIRKAAGVVPYADYILCLIYTGYRPTELFQLTRESYNAEYNYLIGGIKTDAGKNRIVPVSPKIEAIVRERASSGGQYLFPRVNGEIMTLNYFRDAIYYGVLKTIGVRALTPYSCRHTFATLMKDVTAPEVDKAKLMGHEDYNMTKHYTHSNISSLRKITDSI
ncbi:MAG: tyrosine-type recombinase/integrase [Oscillospiraceae bacterium]|nr:tyrosine-type recombinase/integrase [Oscillospiraceae bacterium]